MRNLSPGEEMLFVQKSFWRPSKARYLMKEIKSYKEVFDSEKGSKDLMSYGEGW